MKEKKARVEDALHATRAAVEEGIVAGGGVALLRTAKAIDSLKLEGDEAIGAQIVRRAIEHPIRMLCANAGVEGAVVVGQILAGKGNFGYNVATGDYEDLVKAGVVDPTKVTRTALQNAASIAGLLLTTECMITEIPEKKEAPLAVATATVRRRHGLLRPERFRHLEIISLKKHVGAQRRVFAVGCDESISGDELRAKKVTWNVPKYAEIGDLVLIYRKKPTAAIKDLWIVVGSPVKYNRGNNLGYYPGYQAAISCVCQVLQKGIGGWRDWWIKSIFGMGCRGRGESPFPALGGFRRLGSARDVRERAVPCSGIGSPRPIVRGSRWRGLGTGAGTRSRRGRCAPAGSGV
jgi:hypothetical protein